jgi:hypothetical protein
LANHNNVMTIGVYQYCNLNLFVFLEQDYLKGFKELLLHEVLSIIGNDAKQPDKFVSTIDLEQLPHGFKGCPLIYFCIFLKLEIFMLSLKLPCFLCGFSCVSQGFLFGIFICILSTLTRSVICITVNSTSGAFV